MSTNPWLEIPASDYEGHMGPAGVDQLSALSDIFRQTYVRLRPARVAVLGSATGNGFEHVDPRTTRRLVAVDINPHYIEISRRRFQPLEDVLETVCGPAEACDLGEGSLDLVYAALIFEYLDARALLPKISSRRRRASRASSAVRRP